MTKIFDPNIREKIEASILAKLNSNNDWAHLVSFSPRSIGDAVEEYLCGIFPQCVPDELASSFDSSFSRRAMADFALHDSDGNYLRIDCKTHRLDSDFNMPNLTSVERLARFYKDDSNYFCILKNQYELSGGSLRFTECRFIPIEYLDWDCLTIGALGWGQIQIANAKNVSINTSRSRKEWMLSLCDRLDKFYPGEIKKIQERIDYFTEIRKFWEAK